MSWEVLAEIAGDDAVNGDDFDAICDEFPKLLARVRELEEALRLLRDAHEHESGCALFLPQNECDCSLGVIEAALTPEEPKP